jgi:acylphosphatase
MSIVCRHVFVSGRVQGVAFRYYARQRANELGLGGWVRNLVDGRVEAWLEGDGNAVGTMLDWLRRGPPAARVTGMEVLETEPRGLQAFRVS